MEIKSQASIANENGSKIKSSAAEFIEFNPGTISGGNIDSIDKINEIIDQLKSVLESYKNVAQRDGENIYLIAQALISQDNEAKNMIESGK